MKSISLFFFKIALLSLALMSLVSFLVVVLRFVFGMGWVWLQETVLYLHAVVFLFSTAWALQKEKHVRVDILYANFPKPKTRLVNFLGALFFGLPMVAVVFGTSLPYVLDSWKWLESSSDSGGLPLVFVLKTFIPLFALILAGQIFYSQILPFFRKEK